MIGVSIDIDEVLRINDKDYSITFSTYFNVEWREKRLTMFPEFGASLRPNNSSEHVMVPMNLEFVKDLWLPNIFIYNLKTYKVIDVLSKLAGLWIDTDKNVLYSQATHITFICPMRFDKFPLDTQTCKFRVGSYSYDSSKLLFITKNAGTVFFFLYIYIYILFKSQTWQPINTSYFLDSKPLLFQDIPLVDLIVLPWTIKLVSISHIRNMPQSTTYSKYKFKGAEMH